MCYWWDVRNARSGYASTFCSTVEGAFEVEALRVLGPDTRKFKVRPVCGEFVMPHLPPLDVKMPRIADVNF